MSESGIFWFKKIEEIWNLPCLGRAEKVSFTMSTLKDEILSLKASLNQLEVERRNLIQHFQIQEDNYAATFKQFVEEVELLLKEQEEQIDKLLRQRCDLEDRILGLDEEAPVLQYRW